MKKTKILTIILGIILISLIAFAGIYMQYQNRMENVVKDYELGMNLEGSRVLELEVVDNEITVIKDAEGNVIEETLTDEEITEKGYTKETTVNNSEETYNIENYEKSKKIIEKRLKEIGAEEYLIRLNEESGDITIELPENSSTDHIVSNIGQAGKFEIIDTETEEVLMNNNDIKDVTVMYGRQSEETTDVSVYLNFEFTKEGTKKLEDITNKYVKIEEVETEETTEIEENTETVEEDVTSEEEVAEETVTEKTITLKIDEQEAITTSFEEPITDGMIQLTMGTATSNQDTLQENLKSATTVATLLNNRNLPIEYEIALNQYVISDLQGQVYILMLIVAVIAIILLVILLIKYRVLGLLCGISSIGLLALVSLLIRYTNIDLNVETILAVVITLLVNFVLLIKLLEKVKYSQEIKKGIKDVFVKFFIKIIPICIIAIIFSFIGWNPIYSFGLTLFWGLIVIALYNYLITRTLILIKENK